MFFYDIYNKDRNRLLATTELFNLPVFSLKYLHLKSIIDNNIIDDLVHQQ